MGKERLAALDGLRGVAAIAVALRHARIPGLEMGHGDLAVDLFFLLSGFVIAKSYERQLADGRMSLGRYVVVRVERLYPMLFLGSTIGVAAWLAGWSHVHVTGAGWIGRALISQYMLIPFLAGPLFCLFNGAHWSIFFEMVANLAHAAALPRLTNRALAGIVGVCALGLAFTARHFGELDVGWARDTFLWAFPRVGFGFFGGVLLYRTREAWGPLVPRVPFALLSLILLAVAAAPMRLVPISPIGGLFDFACVILLFPPLVMAATATRLGARGNRIAEVLGTISFPIYAIHKPIVEAFWRFHLSWGQNVAAFVAVVAVSWVLGRYLDEPLNAWRRARRKQRAQLALA